MEFRVKGGENLSLAEHGQYLLKDRYLRDKQNLHQFSVLLNKLAFLPGLLYLLLVYKSVVSFQPGGVL